MRILLDENRLVVGPNFFILLRDRIIAHTHACRAQQCQHNIKLRHDTYTRLEAANIRVNVSQI